MTPGKNWVKPKKLRGSATGKTIRKSQSLPLLSLIRPIAILSGTPMGRTNASKRRSAASQRSRTTRTPIRKRFENIIGCLLKGAISFLVRRIRWRVGRRSHRGWKGQGGNRSHDWDGTRTGPFCERRKKRCGAETLGNRKKDQTAEPREEKRWRRGWWKSAFQISWQVELSWVKSSLILKSSSTSI